MKQNTDASQSSKTVQQSKTVLNKNLTLQAESGISPTSNRPQIQISSPLDDDDSLSSLPMKSQQTANLQQIQKSLAPPENLQQLQSQKLPLPNIKRQLKESLSMILDPEVRAKEEEARLNASIQQNQERLDKMKNELTSTIQDLDYKLQRVVNKNEYDYLQGYWMFVTKKTKELRAIIDKLNEKNSNSSLKDEKIVELELIINKLRNEAQNCDQIMNTRSDEVSKLKNKVELIQEDRRFLYVNARDEKQKNMTMQKRIEQLEKDLEETKQKLEESEKQCTDLKLLNLRNETYDNEELTGGITTARRNKSLTLNRSASKNLSILQNDNYFCPLTQNKKFDEFLNDLFETTSDQPRQKLEILNYVTVVESFYTQQLQKQRAAFEKKIKLSRQGFNSSKVTMFIERNELEKIFQNSIEEVKKQILKRRIKTEALLNNKSKPMYMDQKLEDPLDEDAKRFEEAIVKLVSFAKNKIKYSDFTQSDKYRLIELFVTNEQTLLYVYRSIFQQEAERRSDGNPLKEKTLRDLNRLSPRNKHASMQSAKNQNDSNYHYFITEPTNLDEQERYDSRNNSQQLNKNFQSLDKSIELEDNQNNINTSGYLDFNLDSTIDQVIDDNNRTISGINVGIQLPRIDIKKVNNGSNNDFSQQLNTHANRSKSTLRTHIESNLIGNSSMSTVQQSSRLRNNNSNIDARLQMIHNIGSIQNLRDDSSKSFLNMNRNSVIGQNLTTRKKTVAIRKNVYNPNSKNYESAQLSLFNMSSLDPTLLNNKSSLFNNGNMTLELNSGLASRKKSYQQYQTLGLNTTQEHAVKVTARLLQPNQNIAYTQKLQL
eukprot:403360006